MKIVVFGCSLVQGLRFSSDNYILESWPGYCAFELQTEFNEIVDEVRPDVIVLCIGTNDLGYGYSVQDTLSRIERMWQSARGAKYKLGCFVQEHHGAEYKEFNRIYQESKLCDGFIDFLVDSAAQGFVGDDNLHLTLDGQDAFALAMEGFVDELCAQ